MLITANDPDKTKASGTLPFTPRLEGGDRNAAQENGADLCAPNPKIESFA